MNSFNVVVVLLTLKYVLLKLQNVCYQTISQNQNLQFYFKIQILHFILRIIIFINVHSCIIKFFQT